MKNRTAKESVYDKQIAPLMSSIIKICKENDICLFGYFGLAGPKQKTLTCITTHYSKESSSQDVTVSMLYKIATIDAPIIDSDHVPIIGKAGKAIFNPQFLSPDAAQKLVD